MELESILKILQTAAQGGGTSRRGQRRGLWLLLGDGDGEEARQRILASPAHRELIREMETEAELLLASDLPELSYTLFRQFADSGSRSEYDKTYFTRRKRLTALGLLAWLMPDNRAYADGLCDAVWSVCNEYTWCLTAHLSGSDELRDGPLYGWGEEMAPGRLTVDLFAAETGFALCEIAVLNEERLPPLLARRIREEVRRRIFVPFLQGTYGWEQATHNWAAVCAGSVGAAALYLMDDQEELGRLLKRVLAAMDGYMSGFHDDGVCTEGYLYWQYGFGFYVYFADLLKRYTEGRIDLFASAKAESIAFFQQKCFLDGRKIVNFSDSLPDAGIFLGLAHYLKACYPGIDVPEARLRASYGEDHCGRWAPALRNLIWFNGEEEGRPWSAGDAYMEHAQWLVSRRFTEEGCFVFAAKGGHNDEPHNHNDVGHFLVAAHGEPLLIDLGSGLYTRDYFREGRYEVLCTSSRGHSVPVVNGSYQEPGASSAAVVEEIGTGSSRTVFGLELTAAYKVPELRRLTRRFVWESGGADGPKLAVTDTVLFDHTADAAKLSFTERLMTMALPEEEAPGSVLLRGRQAGLRIRYDPQLLEWSTQTLAHIGHFGERQTCCAVDFTLKQLAAGVEQEVQLAVEFLPVLS